MVLFGASQLLPDGARFREVAGWLLNIVIFGLPTAGSPLYAAGFELNFERYTGGGSVLLNCNRGEGSMMCGGRMGSSSDQTPILLEYVVIDGIEYTHQIIGDPATGWVQEVYLDRLGSGICEDLSCFNNDPLGSEENARGFPTMSVIRQQMSSTTAAGTYSTEFLKDSLLNKAKLTSSIVSDKINYYFESDARGLDFTAANIANKAPIIMTFSLLGPDAVIPPGVTIAGAPDGGNFDFSTDTNFSIVDAGQVSFEPGVGSAPGVYTYYDPASSFNLNQDWALFFDPAQNTDCNSVRPECP